MRNPRAVALAIAAAVPEPHASRLRHLAGDIPERPLRTIEYFDALRRTVVEMVGGGLDETWKVRAMGLLTHQTDREVLEQYGKAA